MPSGGGDEAGAGTGQIGQHRAVVVEHHRAVRYAQHELGALATVAVTAGAGLAVAAALVRVEVEVQQGVHLRIDDEGDIATTAAVAAVRAAQRLELLPVHRGAAVSAVAGREVQHGPVDECCHRCRLLRVAALPGGAVDM